MGQEDHPDAGMARSTEATPSPLDLLRSRSYVVLLVFGALIGVPVAAAAYFFLEGFTELQDYLYGTLPGDLGFDSQPAWWPIPLLALSGLLVALTIRYLPGTAGHKPAEGFKASGPVPPIELPGIVIASFATLSLGVVLGPEAPLIAIGSGLGVLAVHLVKRDAPEMASVVIGAAGSFAAISTLLGSPLPAAFLMMEVAGIGGAMLGVVLAPGLLAAGVGSLIFIGLDDWTGLGTFSLSVPDIPAAGSPGVSEFLWAIVIGVIAAILGVRRQAAGAAAPADRRTPNGAADTCCRRRDRCDRADLRRSNREKLGRGALLGTGSAPGPDRRRRRLDRGRAPDGRPLQGPRVQPLAEQLPRRPHLPEPCSSALQAALRSPTFPACR